jgi:hypothetical protein
VTHGWSRRARILLAACFIAALAPRASALEPKDAAVLPDALELQIGGNRGLHVWWKDGQLHVKEVGGFGPDQGHVFRDEAISPNPAAWTRFWNALDRVDVWRWEPVYRSEHSAQTDGVGWNLNLAYLGRQQRAGGYNAFPDRWGDFLTAVNELTAKPPKPSR